MDTPVPAPDPSAESEPASPTGSVVVANTPASSGDDKLEFRRFTPPPPLVGFSANTATHLHAVNPAAPQPSGLAGALLASQSDDAQAPPAAPRVSSDYPVADWDRYEFLGLLGRGGMGTVYKARDRRIDRIVALKFIAGAGERVKQRFMQEARMQARLDHPGICKIHEGCQNSDGIA